jgi:hypothetical protein
MSKVASSTVSGGGAHVMGGFGGAFKKNKKILA